MINAVYKYFMLGFSFKTDLTKKHIKNIQDKKEEKIMAYEIGAKLGKKENLAKEEINRIVEILQITTSEKMQSKIFQHNINNIKQIIDVIEAILQNKNLNTEVVKSLEDNLKDYWQIYLNRIVQQVCYDLKILIEGDKEIINISDINTHMLNFISIKDYIENVKLNYLVLLKKYFKEEEKIRTTLQKVEDKPKETDIIFIKLKDIVNSIFIPKLMK